MKEIRTYVRRLFYIFLLLVLSLLLISCSQGEEKDYDAYLPPEEADFDEEIYPDANSSFTFNGYEILENADGQEEILISYNWTNHASSPKVAMDAYLLTAEQYNTALEPDLSLVRDEKKLVTEIEAGETLENIEQGFILTDDEEDVVLYLKGEETTFIKDNTPIYSYPVKIVVDI